MYAKRSWGEHFQKLSSECNNRIYQKISIEKWSLFATVATIYTSTFLDNVLRAVIVPILPDLLISKENTTYVETETDAVLLASKGVIQLAVNSLVVVLASKLGYYSSLATGNLILLITSLLFACGHSFAVLMLARSLHGVASTIITICVMCICADTFSTDPKLRNDLMGLIMGSDALAICSAYTVGVFIYQWFGSNILFLSIAFGIFVNTGLLFYNEGKTKMVSSTKQLSNLQMHKNREQYCHLIQNPSILMVFGALFLSTLAVSVLEPCLPVWLKKNPNLKDWQTRFVFLPDSVGYLLGTSLLGPLSYRMGKWNATTVAMITIGISSILIPNTTSFTQLSIPHLSIGLGTGAVDSILIPMLADLINMQKERYSSVYALEHGITSLAYVCGYLSTAKLVERLGFPKIISAVGILNILYAGAILIFQYWTKFSDTFRNERMKLIRVEGFNRYHSFDNSEDSDEIE